MKCGWARIYCPDCSRQICQRQIVGAHLAVVAASACDRCRCRSSSALVLVGAVVAALAGTGCGLLADGPAPDDMIDVGGAHVARGCILHRPADVATCELSCTAYNFEGETGCCIPGAFDDEPALYWRDCEGP